MGRHITNRSSSFRACGPPPDPKRLRPFGPLNSNVRCTRIMMNYLQANRASESDNDLLKNAILDHKHIEFEMHVSDARAVLNTFSTNYKKGSNGLAPMQRIRIFIGNLWNSSYGNVARFIIHMNPLNLEMKIEEGVGKHGAQLHVKYVPD